MWHDSTHVMHLYVSFSVLKTSTSDFAESSQRRCGLLKIAKTPQSGWETVPSFWYSSTHFFFWHPPSLFIVNTTVFLIYCLKRELCQHIGKGSPMRTRSSSRRSPSSTPGTPSPPRRQTTSSSPSPSQGVRNTSSPLSTPVRSEISLDERSCGYSLWIHNTCIGILERSNTKSCQIQ